MVRTARVRGRPVIPRGGPTRPRSITRLPPGLGVAWRGLARAARFRMRPRVQRSWPQPALPAAELGARRSQLSPLSGRSRDAAGAAKARRRLGLGRAPHWLAPRVTRPAPPRPHPPAAHALSGLFVDLHWVLRCARETGSRTHLPKARRVPKSRPRGTSGAGSSPQPPPHSQQGPI